MQLSNVVELVGVNTRVDRPVERTFALMCHDVVMLYEGTVTVRVQAV
jgi:hypothetical protein